MIKKLLPQSIRSRILFTLIALILTTLAGGMATVWYAESIGSLFNTVIDRDIVSFENAEELETALAMQKGFTTYFFSG